VGRILYIQCVNTGRMVRVGFMFELFMSFCTLETGQVAQMPSADDGEQYNSGFVV